MKYYSPEFKVVRIEADNVLNTSSDRTYTGNENDNGVYAPDYWSGLTDGNGNLPM